MPGQMCPGETAMENHQEKSDGKLRHGFTTGSCAAAGAKAAAWMLFSGTEKKEISIMTPKGIPYTPAVENISRQKDAVSCAVRKDGGDDPDVTNGMPVVVTVSILPDHAMFTQTHAWEDVQFPRENADGAAKQAAGGNVAAEETNTADGAAERRIWIDGGFGVGRVTKPGLDQPVGNAAINHVPREMITKEVSEVCSLFDYEGNLYVEVSLPEGERLAGKTYNPRFGIMGGISVVGTTGVVEPMSAQALLDTIRVELRQQKALGKETVVVSPGNYGQDFMLRTYGYNLDDSVKCSNFIGLTIDMVRELGFKTMLLVGHAGKLIKVAGGIMNTHSHEADCRMEVTAACALRCGADADTAREVLACISTEEAVRVLQRAGCMEAAMQDAIERIEANIQRRAGDDLHCECMMYTNDTGLLAATDGAEAILRGQA